MVTDGPFAETKEQLGGFYLLDCADLDEALAWAKRRSRCRGGIVEVRPVMDYEAAGSEAQQRARRRRAGVAATDGGRRPPVPARVGAGGRDPDPRPRRLRPRRGGRAGRVRGRARALAARRRARATRAPGSSATARNRAIDRIRRERRYDEKLRELDALDAGSPRTRRTSAR